MQAQYSWMKLHKYMNLRKSASFVLFESNKFHILEVNHLSKNIWEGTALVLTTDSPLPVWKPLTKHLCSTRCQYTMYGEHAQVSQKHCRSVEGNWVAVRFVFQDKFSPKLGLNSQSFCLSLPSYSDYSFAHRSWYWGREDPRIRANSWARQHMPVIPHWEAKGKGGCRV